MRPNCGVSLVKLHDPCNVKPRNPCNVNLRSPCNVKPFSPRRVSTLGLRNKKRLTGRSVNLNHGGLDNDRVDKSESYEVSEKLDIHEMSEHRRYPKMFPLPQAHSFRQSLWAVSERTKTIR